MAESEGEIVGSVIRGYEGHRGWINYLAVAAAQRRSGLARQLMREAEERLAALGCPKVNLQVRADNGDALSFYRSIGYAVDDVVSFGKRLEDDS